jgi:hypothetical protein
MCHSPRLIAACHVLHRLVSPRHSPTALINLVFSINPKSPISILTLIYHPEMTFITSDVSFFKTLNFQRTYEVLSHTSENRFYLKSESLLCSKPAFLAVLSAVALCEAGVPANALP